MVVAVLVVVVSVSGRGSGVTGGGCGGSDRGGGAAGSFEALLPSIVLMAVAIVIIFVVFCIGITIRKAVLHMIAYAIYQRVYALHRVSNSKESTDDVPMTSVHLFVVLTILCVARDNS